MGKKARILHKRQSSIQAIGDNAMPRRELRSSSHLPSKVLQDNSLPSERSLQVRKSMTRHLDSVAATPGNIRPRRMFSDNTDASDITLTPGWKKYLEKTYHLNSDKHSSLKSVSDNPSITEGSGNLEDMLKSPGKQRHFRHRRGKLIPKNVGTQLFVAAFTNEKPQSPVVLPPQPKRDHEISVEDIEEASPILSSQTFKRRRTRNVTTNRSVFQVAFEDSVNVSSDSAADVSERRETSISLKTTVESTEEPKSNASLIQRDCELNRQSDISSISPSAKRRQTRSSHAFPDPSGEMKNVALSSVSALGSVILPPPPQRKSGNEISAEEFKLASSVVSQPLKSKRSTKINPTIFEGALEEFGSSLTMPEVDVSNRQETSISLKTTVETIEEPRNNASRIKRDGELIRQSDVSSISPSGKRRQTRSSLAQRHPSGEMKNVALSSVSALGSVILPLPQRKSGNDISAEEFKLASSVVSQPLKSKRNAKINPTIFEGALGEFGSSSTTSEKDVSIRQEESVSLKSTAETRSNASRIERDGELNRHSDVSSISPSAKRRQTRLSHALPDPSGEMENVALSSLSAHGSVILPPPPPPQRKSGNEISAEEFKLAISVVSQPLKSKRNIKTNPTVFEGAWEEFGSSLTTSEVDVSNRGEASISLKTTVETTEEPRSNASRMQRDGELNRHSDVSSISASAKRRQTRSSQALLDPSQEMENVALSSVSSLSSVILPPPPQRKSGNEISAEEFKLASSVVSQPLKSKRNTKINPTIFEGALGEFGSSLTMPEVNVSNRPEKSVSLKTTEIPRSNDSRIERDGELIRQSDVSLVSPSGKRRQTRSSHALPDPSEEMENASLRTYTPQFYRFRR